MRFNLFILLIVFQTTNEEEFHPDSIQTDGFQVSGFISLVTTLCSLTLNFIHQHTVCYIHALLTRIFHQHSSPTLEKPNSLASCKTVHINLYAYHRIAFLSCSSACEIVLTKCSFLYFFSIRAIGILHYLSYAS